MWGDGFIYVIYDAPAEASFLPRVRERAPTPQGCATKTGPANKQTLIPSALWTGCDRRWG